MTHSIFAGILAANFFSYAAGATDLPRLNTAKPSLKETGRNLECCDGPRADLRLVTLDDDFGGGGLPNTGFCGNLDRAYHTVVFAVVNMGSAGASSTIARVDFGTLGRFDVSIPALPPGVSSRGHVTIPRQNIRLGDQVLRFQISVDPANSIAESNEGNNMARSYCRSAITRVGTGR
jgi:hypothetical protein